MSQRPYMDPGGSGLIGSVSNYGQDDDCPHPQDQVYAVDDCGQGCCTDYRCRKCGQTFRFEWPD